MRKISWIATLCLISLMAASLASAIEVTGRVVDEFDEGQAGAEVRFYEEEDSGEAAPVWTDEDGVFTLEVEPGRYRVEVTLGELSHSEVVEIDDSGEPLTLRVEW